MQSYVRICAALALAALLLAAAGPAQALRIGDPPPSIVDLEVLGRGPLPALDWESLHGRVVVLDFWAPWCGPCRDAVPHQNALLAEVRDLDLLWISATAESEEAVERFLEGVEMEGRIALDPGGDVARAYGVPAMPWTVVVGPDGLVAGVTRPDSLTADHLRSLAAGEALDAPVHPLARGVTAGLDLGETGEALERLELRRSTPGAGKNWAFEDDRLTCLGYRPVELFATAYGVRSSRVEGADALPPGCFDLIASSPGVDQDSFHAQLLATLEEQFAVESSRVQREVSAIVLSSGRKTEKLLIPAAEKGPPSIQRSPGGVRLRNAPIDALTSILEELLSAPVVDETGLTGLYDFELSWDPAFPDEVLAQVRRDLGLKTARALRLIDHVVLESTGEPADPP